MSIEIRNLQIWHTWFPWHFDLELAVNANFNYGFELFIRLAIGPIGVSVRWEPIILDRHIVKEPKDERTA